MAADTSSQIDPTLEKKKGSRSKNWDDESSLLLIAAYEEVEHTRTGTSGLLIFVDI